MSWVILGSSLVLMSLMVQPSCSLRAVLALARGTTSCLPWAMTWYMQCAQRGRLSLTQQRVMTLLCCRHRWGVLLRKMEVSKLMGNSTSLRYPRMKVLSSDASALGGFLLHSGVICLGDLIGYSLYSDFSLRFRFIAIENITFESLGVAFSEESALLEPALLHPTARGEGTVAVEEVGLEVARVGVLSFVVLPMQVAVLLGAQVELPCEFEGFAAFDSLSMREVAHEVALIDHVSLSIGTLSMGQVALEVALVAVAIPTNVPAST